MEDQIIMKQPTLFEILKTALYIGTVGYGGPAILALMKKVIVHDVQNPELIQHHEVG